MTSPHSPNPSQSSGPGEEASLDDTSDLAIRSQSNLLSKKTAPKSFLIASTSSQKNISQVPFKHRTQEANIFTSETSNLNRVAINMKMERRIEGLPSICINQSQHSGTLFLNNRFMNLGYNRFWFINGPWFNMEYFDDFQSGSQFAQTDLLPNQYNIQAALQIIEYSKFWLHFRDPRSSIVSAVHLMDRSFLGKKRP